MNYILAFTLLTVQVATAAEVTAAAEATGLRVPRELAKAGKKTKKSKQSKSSKSSKSPRDMVDVLEEYQQFKDMRVNSGGLPSLFDPLVIHYIHNDGVNVTSEEIASIGIAPAEEDQVVKCSKLCNEMGEREGKECTTFGIETFFNSEDSGDAHVNCAFLNNNAHKRNPMQIVRVVTPPGPLQVRFDTYHRKVELPLLSGESTVIEGIFPLNVSSADFGTYALPAFQCVEQQENGNFTECNACFLSNIRKSCKGNAAQICGVPGSGDCGPEPYKNVFMDKTCGIKCFSGDAANYVCLSVLQTNALAVFNQRFVILPELGYAFGCSMSNVVDPTTGVALPDYTCPPNITQPVPDGN